MVGAAPRADAREHVVGELQLVHAVDGSGARAARRTRPAGFAGAYSGKAEVSSSTSALHPAERRLVRMGEGAVDQLGDAHHLRRAHAARGERRRAEADAAGDERRLRVVRDGVLVDRDAGLVERLLGDLAGEALGPEVDQHQVVVGAARDDGEAALDQRRRPAPCAFATTCRA